MTLEQFLKLLNTASPTELATESFHRNFVYAIPDEKTYKAYVDRIKIDYPNANQISIMGSGNWGYSLNPKKNFGLFNDQSDIDIAIVCPLSFNLTWEALREYHRTNYYLLDFRGREALKRNGENVYSGFISPKWIPDRTSKLRFSYELNANKYSDSDVGYKPVNMFYFKDLKEVIDYYVRGFTLAKNRK